jgi:hypothetical protein
LLGGLLLVGGCSTYRREGVSVQRAREVQRALSAPIPVLSHETEDRILALNPGHVTARDVRETLSNAPAPRIINIHGGVDSVLPRMISFSEFLVGMGYPLVSITNPVDGTYTFSCYESSTKIAGFIAWSYEQEGLRPMMVGHSQGGFQVVKILRKLAGDSGQKLAVWNPLTWTAEDRCAITDPLTGQVRPVVGLQLPYATAVGAGGLTRFLPNQWDMLLTLRRIPDSVEEFTGFFKGTDLLGGDYLGHGPANYYEPAGKAAVRNVRLPSWYKHGAIPDTKHLLRSQAIMDWINDYQPPSELVSAPLLPKEFDADSTHILWAADVWYSIKKHWVLELQRIIRAQRAQARTVMKKS